MSSDGSNTYVAVQDRYEQMPYDRAGRSGLKLPRLSLGLWNNFGTDRALDSQRAIVRRAFDLGVSHFDLANNYGPPEGAAETNFGRIVECDLRPYRDEIIVSTKAGHRMWPGPFGDGGSRKSMLASLDQSLTRLGLDYVDIFYSHCPDPDVPIEETMGALADAVRAGKVLYVGISKYDPEQTRYAAAALEQERVPLLIHQPRYNMFDRAPEHGLFGVLDELAVGAIAFSPLAQGMLTNRYLEGVPPDSRAAEGRWMTGANITDTYLQRVRKLDAIAKDRGQTLAQLALTWVLRAAPVTSALVGASSVSQLEDSLAAANAPALSDDELTKIEPLAIDGTENVAEKP